LTIFGSHTNSKSPKDNDNKYDNTNSDTSPSSLNSDSDSDSDSDSNINNDLEDEGPALDADDNEEIAQQNGETFNVASDMNMMAVELHDMLSDKPLTRSHPLAPVQISTVVMSLTTKVVSWAYET